MSDIIQTIESAYNKTNDYFGVESIEDQFWFYGFIVASLFFMAFLAVVNLMN